MSTQDQTVAPRWSRGQWVCVDTDSAGLWGFTQARMREGKLGYLWHPLFQVILIPQKGIKSLSFLPSLLSFLLPAPALSLPPFPPSFLSLLPSSL